MNRTTPLRPLKTIAFLSTLAWVLPLAGGENWPAWRGPNADGSTDSKNLPLTWNLENVLLPVRLE